MKVKQILGLFVLFLCLYILSTPVQAAETSYYDIKISLLPEGYAEFEINVDNYGDFGERVIELPILKCDDTIINMSDVRKKIRVSDIPDDRTGEGLVDLSGSCMGVLIDHPRDFPKNFTISFTYENSDWEFHPEKYPFDDYSTPILISIPKISSEDRAWVYTSILLPPNTKAKNLSAYRLWGHPFTTPGTWHDNGFTIDTRGNQQILRLDSHGDFSKENSPQAIYIHLEFERDGWLPLFFVVTSCLLVIILSFLTIPTLQGKDTGMGILTIAVLLFSYYQFLASDKPAGVITWLDWTFFIFIVWSLILFAIYLERKYHIRRELRKLFTKATTTY